jgi:hypothetical protein
LAITVVLAFGTVEVKNAPRWLVFWQASPNEIGDTIAGIASALAFLWIIVTVLIQGNELRLQRRDLAMTRREMRGQREASEAMAVAQAAQVAALKEQAAILQEERLLRSQDQAAVLLDRMLDDLAYEIEFDKRVTSEWRLRQFKEKSESLYLFHLDSPFVDGNTLDIRIRNYANASYKNSIRLREAAEQGQLLRRCGKKSYYQSIATRVERIEAILPDISEAQRYRVQSLGLFLIKDDIENLTKIDSLWDEVASE